MAKRIVTLTAIAVLTLGLVGCFHDPAPEQPVDPAAQNTPPVAHFAYDAADGVRAADVTEMPTFKGKTVLHLDASASFDPDGDGIGYRWKLDGDPLSEQGNTPDPTVPVSQIGVHSITLTVVDSQGATSSPTTLNFRIAEADQEGDKDGSSDGSGDEDSSNDETACPTKEGFEVTCVETDSVIFARYHKNLPQVGTAVIMYLEAKRDIRLMAASDDVEPDRGSTTLFANNSSAGETTSTRYVVDGPSEITGKARYVVSEGTESQTTPVLTTDLE